MKTYIKYILSVMLIISIIIFYFYIKKNDEFINKINSVIIKILNKQIKEDKTKAFSFAYALSQNETLQNAILEDDKIKAYSILKKYMSTLETFSGYKLNTQILSKDYVIFARSWDNRDAGINVKKSRKDLEDIFKTKKPHLSYEAARRLVLIASIPIIVKNKIIGFVEVIERFKNLKNYFKNFDIDLIVLLNPKYDNQAVLLNHKNKIYKYTIANKNINNLHKINLNKKKIEKLLNLGYINSGDYHYFSKSIYNAKNKNIGYFILSISNERIKLFSSFEKKLSSFFTYAQKDLYNNAIKTNNSINEYQGFSINGLLMAKLNSNKNENSQMDKILRVELYKLSKEELINLLLNKDANKKIRGKIR